jgi:hypothetical protein
MSVYRMFNLFDHQDIVPSEPCQPWGSVSPQFDTAWNRKHVYRNSFGQGIYTSSAVNKYVLLLYLRN